jgi:hypothetical protein
MTGWDIRVTGCDTGISGVGVKVTDFDFRVERLRVSGCSIRVTDYCIRVPGYDRRVNWMFISD